MILLVDAGNTRLKWGLWQGGHWLDRGWLPAGRPHDLSGSLDGRRPEWIGVSCVGGERQRALLEAELAWFDCPRFWLRAEARRYGLLNRYEDPGRLGPDRYAMLLACLRMGLAPCVVVGAGTALTADALTGEGEYLGGLILPGMELMRRALREGTAGVGEVSGRACEFPRSTGDGVETGILTALSAGAEALRGRLARRVGGEVRMVLTGGDATRLAGQFTTRVEVVEDLVLEGLSWIARVSDVPGA